LYPALSLLAIAQTTLAFRQTSPLLGFSSTPECHSHALYVTLPNLEQADLSHFKASDLENRYQSAFQQTYAPFVSHSSRSRELDQRLSDLTRPCAQGAQEEHLILESLGRRKGRKARLAEIDAQLAQKLASLPTDHLVVISSHPGLAKRSLTKRQESIEESTVDDEVVESLPEETSPEAQETAADISVSDPFEVVEEALGEAQDDLEEAISSSTPDEDVETSTEFDQVLTEEAQEQVENESMDDPLLSQFIPAPSATVDVMQQEVPKIDVNKLTYLEAYSITSPSLIFSTLLFLLVLFPAAYLSIGALGAIELPTGLETKMTGLSGDKEKKDQ